MDELIKNMPEDTSEIRKKIVMQAADAVGKIPYYWGGSAKCAGYDGNDYSGRSFIKRMDNSITIYWKDG